MLRLGRHTFADDATISEIARALRISVLATTRVCRERRHKRPKRRIGGYAAGSGASRRCSRIGNAP